MEAAEAEGLRPGARVLLDAHNCYPEHGQFGDRIERALSTGLPVAIEQDLFWYRDPQTGKAWSVVTHGEPVTGAEPTLRTHFLERVRPLMEQALRENNRKHWPLITLNLDFKTKEPEHLQEIWNILGDYEAWLTTAERVADGSEPAPLSAGPLLVLTGMDVEQEAVFHDQVPVGGRLRLFGAVIPTGDRAVIPAEELVPGRATNYRRWWNNPWKVVEAGGQQYAYEWTPADEKRLRALVQHAHSRGLWIRFYTLNGLPAADSQARGWGKGYNFGSKSRVERRWRAAIEAGVDYVATDQYEDFGVYLQAWKANRQGIEQGQD
jgi:hypothetical protein